MGILSLYDAVVFAAPYLLLVFASYIAHDCWKAYRSPLSQLPGPWYAPFTNMHLTLGFARGTVWKMVEGGHNKYGPIMRLGPRQIWVADKVALKQIIQTIDLPKVMMYAEISREKESAGLFGEVRPQVHKRLRKTLAPAFSVTYIDQLDTLFQKPVRDMMDHYQNTLGPNYGDNGIKVNLMENLHRVALEIMGECAFGRGFGSVAPDTTPEPGFSLEAWQKIPDAAFSGCRSRYALVYFKRALRRFGIRIKFDWPTEMVKAIDSVISRRQKGDNDERRDLLQHLIKEGHRPDNGKKMNSRDILDNLSELLLAGAETTSATMCYLFLELARNRDVRQKLMGTLPLLSVSDPLLDGVNIRNDPKYDYLTACIKENLRMHPIASELGRRTLDTPVVLNGVEVPPYTVVSASYRAIHLNEEHWPQANRFWPERFLPQNHPLKGDAPDADLTAYFPFSGGAHSCVGMNFAWHEMRVVIANYMARFDIQEVPGQKLDIRQFITMQFHDGNWNAVLYPRATSEM